MKHAEIKAVYDLLLSVKYRIQNELAASYSPNVHIGYYDSLLGNIERSINKALRPIEHEYKLNAPEVIF